MAEQRAGVRRRSQLEADRLVAAYESSGLTQREFCAQEGLALASLSRYRRCRKEKPKGNAGGRLVAVEVVGQQKRPAEPELAVVLGSGLRIEVRSGFDRETLQQLMQALERA
jgi:hypothetical protein